MPMEKEGSREITEESAAGERHDATVAAQQSEQLNDLVDVDDELAALADRLAWLSDVPWTNQRIVAEFGPFVDQKIAECESHMSAIHERWKREWAAQNPVGG
jgi:hypothetical protein